MYPSSPVENVGPLNQLYTAMTFKDPLDHKNSKPFPADAKRMTLEQAVKAVTINPAWQIRMEDKIGTLEMGKYADIFVLDKNLFDIKDPADILICRCYRNNDGWTFHPSRRDLRNMIFNIK